MKYLMYFARSKELFLITHQKLNEYYGIEQDFH